MKLVTKQTDIKSRIDRIVRLQYDATSDELAIYFNTSTLVDGEELGETFDASNPLLIPVSQVEDFLNSIFNKALELRSEQIEGNSTIKTAPDYSAFFNILLALPIFQLIQQKRPKKPTLETAATDFGILLMSMASASSEAGLTALQNSLDRVLAGLEDVTQEQLQELQDAINANAIPLKVTNLEET